jgi:prepilin-type N-terminal cleavage/methylation domain-containing protein
MRNLAKAIRRLYRGGEKGFTLIELLVVIGILALLAGVVTIGVTQFIGRGAHEAACTDLHNVQTAVAAYMVDSSGNVPPADVDTMVPDYLLQTPKCTYDIDQSTGAVSNQDCTGTEWEGKECNP